MGFALLSLCLLGLSVMQWRQISQAEAIHAALAEIPAQLTWNSAPPGWRHYPETRLAFANALSAGGDFEGAETIFNELARQFAGSNIGISAQFNLANAYMRQGMHEEQTENRRRTMLELAKQRYREILQIRPDDWQLRFNLERALRLAPEHFDADGLNKEVIKRVNVIVPDFKMKDLP